MNKVVKKTSHFPASKHEVYNLLKNFDILSKIAFPYVTFNSLDGDNNINWQVGETYRFKARLIGFIPFGIHTINVVKFDEEDGVYTNEQNTYVPTWNHEVILRKIDENTTEYTDEVEIGAGWKTYFVYLWATLFYRHRQKKWIKILKGMKA